jgi:hypothetical protein
MPAFQKMLALLILPQLSVSASDAPPPPMDTLVQQVIARGEATLESLKSLEFHATMKIEQLDGQGAVTKQQKMQLLVRPGAAQEIEILSNEGGTVPAHPQQPNRQTQDLEDRKSQVNMGLKDLVSRFSLAVTGTVSLQGQQAYVVTFEPKPDQSYQNLMIKILNYIHGRVWISTRDYSVLRFEANLTQPVPVAWILAHVSAVYFHYDMNYAPGIMGPARILASFRFEAPLILVNQRITIETTQFQPRTKT